MASLLTPNGSVVPLKDAYDFPLHGERASCGREVALSKIVDTVYDIKTYHEAVDVSESEAERLGVTVAELTERRRSLHVTEMCARFQFLQTVMAKSADVFYAALLSHTRKLLPIVYTPAIGAACLK